MQFFELTLTTDSVADSDALSELLQQNGAQAITLQSNGNDDILEPAPQTTPLWEQIRIIALFQDRLTMHRALQLLQSQYHNIQYAITCLADQDWLHSSIADCKPICIGGRLWIHPDWAMPPDDAAITLQLNPGLAFGTGTHPTTAMCLDWLTQHELYQHCVIDYGCGSGILAIAALKLGAQFAYAVDIEEQAITACRDNARLNNISAAQLAISTPSQLPDVKADLLIANILANPLIELAPAFIKLLQPHGSLLLSGILVVQEQQIIQHYQQQDAIQAITVVTRRDEWSLLHATLRY